MGMSTNVAGIRPPDEKWKQMKAVRDACVAAGVAIPKDVDAFFNDETPDPSGVLLCQSDLGAAVRKWEAQDRNGFEVDVTKLPPGVKIIRFWNRW